MARKSFHIDKLEVGIGDASDRELKRAIRDWKIVGAWTLFPTNSQSCGLPMLSSPIIVETSGCTCLHFHVGKNYIERESAPVSPRFFSNSGSNTLTNGWLNWKGFEPSVPAWQLKQYDPTTLGLRDLRTIYQGLNETKDDGSDWGVFLRFVDARLTSAEMRGLFESKDKWDNSYALLRARYERKPAYANDILNALSRYTGKTLLMALDTLSILRGTRVTLEDWRTFRNGRRLAQANIEIECDHYSPGSLLDLKPTDMGQLNACLREKADKTDPHLLRDIEQVGWLDIPLTYSGMWIVSRVFPDKRQK